MKRFLIFLTFICASYLYALDNKYENIFSFTITPQFEIANGLIKEYVFDSECKNTDNKESQLDWNIKTIALFNIQADFDIIRYMYIGLSGTFAVSQRSDFMQDYDWLNSVGSTNGHPSWESDDPTERTNFSEHINQLDKFINFRFFLGGNIYLPAEIKLTPHISYEYEFIKFSASGGYSIYKWDNYKKVSFPSGKVISYEQEFSSFLLGLNIKVDCIPHTLLKINFDISPCLTALTAIDTHFVTKHAYMDSFKNLLLLESGLTAQYKFTKNHSAGINGNLQYIPLSKGTTSENSIDSDGKFMNDEWAPLSVNGGTERFIWSLGLNYSFSL